MGALVWGERIQPLTVPAGEGNLLMFFEGKSNSRLSARKGSHGKRNPRVAGLEQFREGGEKTAPEKKGVCRANSSLYKGAQSIRGEGS